MKNKIDENTTLEELDEIAFMEEVVTEVKEIKHMVDKMNLIILSDGDSNSIYAYEDQKIKAKKTRSNHYSNIVNSPVQYTNIPSKIKDEIERIQTISQFNDFISIYT